LSEHLLEPIFNPRSVALVGVSSRPAMGLGGMLQTGLMEFGFDRSRIYPVNPKTSEVSGLTCYPTLLDTPDPVDYVVSLVPARVVPGLVEQCVEKDVRCVHFFTAGFSETGDPEMANVEREMIATLRAAGIRTVGPNCLGLYLPDAGLSFGADFPKTPGNMFLLSQSGWNAGGIIRSVAARGIRFSKAISYGNGADLKAHDFLDYAASDPSTSAVMAYIEGVGDGRAFFEALKRCAAEKPTILLKGGITDAGARAASSHTASLAGSIELFDALCAQVGALRAETMDDLHDLAVGVSTSAARVRERETVLIGGPGGFAVLSADDTAKAGLRLARLPDWARDELHEFVPVAGSSVDNPLDVMLRAPGHLERALRIVTRTAGTGVVLSTSPDAGGAGGHGGDQTAAAGEWAAMLRRVEDDSGVPVVAVRPPSGGGPDPFVEAAFEHGISVFPTVARAARTVSTLITWREQREGLPVGADAAQTTFGTRRTGSSVRHSP
jgi:acyl-CoA synthetase (NDP forming)